MRKGWAALAAGAAVAAAAGCTAIAWFYAPSPRATRLRVVETPRDSRDPAAPASAPNVIVVIGCTLRRDQLGVHDPTLDTTPGLEALGAAGVVFDDVITAAPWTRPASVALLTGRHALTVGMVEPGDGSDRKRLADAVLTMPEHFRGRGWTTIGGTANPNVSTTWNLAQGFDRYVEPAGIWQDGPSAKLPARKLIDAVLPEVDARPPDRPLYLQLVLIEAHAPVPPANPNAVAADRSVPEQVHAYRDAVRRFDRAVADLHLALADRGFDDRDTLLVVVNDHGEGLDWPEHHGHSHGRFLAPSAVGGVWVMRGPGVPAGARVAGVVSQVDVFPTLAELAGVPVTDPDVAGQSQVSALVTGRSLRDAAFTDTWFGTANRAAVYTAAAACQQDWSSGEVADAERFQSGCFDRARDPAHHTPLGDPQLGARLQAWREQAERAGARFEGAADADPDAATIEALKALGYHD